MNAINCDDPLARCQEGNLFRVNTQSGSLVAHGIVNGKDTGVLPHNQRMLLPNSLKGSVNSLSMKLNGTTYPICSNVEQLSLSKPQDLGVLLSEIPQDADVGKGRLEQEILVAQVPPSMQDLPEGEIDIDTASEGLLAQVAVAILVTLEVIDEVSGTQALYESTGADIDLRMTGTDGPPAISDAVAALRTKNSRAAVRALVDGGKGALRVARNGAGVLVVMARLKPGMTRQFMAGVALSLTRSRMAQVVTGTHCRHHRRR
jgi:hypothetical protein